MIVITAFVAAGNEPDINNIATAKTKKEEKIIATTFQIAGSNPFNPTTYFSYSLADESHVKLEIFNSIGQVVAVLVNQKHHAGHYNRVFNAGHLPSGTYIARLTAGSSTLMKKVILLK